MEEVLKVLTEELNQRERAAMRNAEKLCRYDDIRDEFLKWAQTKEFGKNGLTIDGYTAEKISELAPFMNGVGVYNFMVTLRDNPETAHEIIAAGFPVK